jgi:hypothetical protein
MDGIAWSETDTKPSSTTTVCQSRVKWIQVMLKRFFDREEEKRLAPEIAWYCSHEQVSAVTDNVARLVVISCNHSPSLAITDNFPRDFTTYTITHSLWKSLTTSCDNEQLLVITTN